MTTMVKVAYPTAWSRSGHVRVAVIGAGFGGLAVAHELRAAGIEDFVVLERGATVGGTWRENTYPGCGCDIPSHLYSFSFAPNPRWSRAYSGQPEILRYLEDVARTLDPERHIALGVTVHEAHWDDVAARWLLRTSSGPLSADILVAASGPLTEPSLPVVPGLDEFPGPVLHSAQWRHDVELTGKRVAVIGTGASAVQLIPQLQPRVERLYLFQRTPAWVIPKRDRRLTPVEHAMYARVPALQRAARAFQYTVREMSMPGFVSNPKLLRRTGERLARFHLAQQVKDPELRAVLTPSYSFGCKRVLPSNDYYPALTRPNVQVIPHALSAVEGDRAIAADGTSAEVDAILLGTGFDLSEPPIARLLHGREGATLAQVWARGGRQALRGTTIAGFPNFFLMLGPNSGLGNNSMVYIIESQAAYVVDAVQAMGAGRLAAIEPRPDVQQQWDARMQQRMERTVWQTGGCVSWYQDAEGRNRTLWPSWTFHFRHLTRRADLSEYEQRLTGPDIWAARAPGRPHVEPAPVPAGTMSHAGAHR